MKKNPFNDTYFMREALKEAEKGVNQGEVPVGAVIVCENKIIARAHNSTEKLNDVTAHAEILAFTSASDFLGGKYLNECTMYVTLEPCVMCAGAAYWARLKRLVCGALDLKRGHTQISQKILHPKTEFISGILAEKCSKLLIEFFKAKR